MQVPVIYAYLYSKIKNKERGRIIKVKALKNVIGEVILRRSEYKRKHNEKRKKLGGGSTKGLPRIYIYDIIKDMEELHLIKKLTQQKFQILKSNCEKKLRHFPF